jgi:hypothetical protein
VSSHGEDLERAREGSRSFGLGWRSDVVEWGGRNTSTSSDASTGGGAVGELAVVFGRGGGCGESVGWIKRSGRGGSGERLEGRKSEGSSETHGCVWRWSWWLCKRDLGGSVAWMRESRRVEAKGVREKAKIERRVYEWAEFDWRESFSPCVEWGFV